MTLSDEQIAEIARIIDPEDLPGDLPEVADYIGTYKALLLGYKMGAGRIYLKRWSDDPESWSQEIRTMVEILGIEDTRTIVRMFSGAHIDIPKCDRFWRAWIHRLIVSSDERQIDLARKFGYTDRHIRRIQKRHRAQTNAEQIDLFD